MNDSDRMSGSEPGNAARPERQTPAGPEPGNAAAPEPQTPPGLRPESAPEPGPGKKADRESAHEPRPGKKRGPANGAVPQPDEHKGGEQLDLSEGAPMDPAEGLRIINEQRHTVVLRTSPDGRVLYGVWGAAWLVGYLAMYASSNAHQRPAAWAGATFGGLLLLAVVITAVHVSRRTAGVRGDSARIGAMFGLAWVASFAVGFVLIGAITRRVADVPDGGELIAIASNGISCLIVAALYMAGAAAFRDERLFALGAWIAIVTGSATLLGLPNLYLVMALAGGGGFLVAAVIEHLRHHRQESP